MTERIDLGKCTVVMGDEPLFVRKCVDDLQNFVPSTGDGVGEEVPIFPPPVNAW